jgi:Ca2+-binding EF-hand superfamily protein
MTISSVGSSSLLQQLLQARAAAATQTKDADSTSDDAFAGLGQNLPSAGKDGSAPALPGWSSSGQGFSADTLASLLSAQQTSQSSQTDRAAAMFDEADADGDGSVTADELATAMAAHAPSHLPAGAPSPTDKAAQLLAKGDSDGDGKLSMAEFKAMKPHGGHHHGGGAPPVGANDDATQQASSSSSSSSTTDPDDLNGDGVVTADELAQTLNSAFKTLGSDVSSASSLMQKLLSQLAAASTGGAGSSASTGASVSVAA